MDLKDDHMVQGNSELFWILSSQPPETKAQPAMQLYHLWLLGYVQGKGLIDFEPGIYYMSLSVREIVRANKCSLNSWSTMSWFPTNNRGGMPPFWSECIRVKSISWFMRTTVYIPAYTCLYTREVAKKVCPDGWQLPISAAFIPPTGRSAGPVYRLLRGGGWRKSCLPGS